MNDEGPYAPPTAPLEEPDPQAYVPAPKPVAVAVGLLFFSLLLGAYRAVLDPNTLPDDTPGWFGALVRVVSFLLMGALYLLILRRRNWARVLFLVFFTVGLMSWVVFGPPQSVNTTSRWIVYTAQALLGLAASVLLLLPGSSAWYRSRHRPRHAA